MAKRDEDDARTLGRNARVVHRGQPKPDRVPPAVQPPAPHVIVPPGEQAAGSTGGRMGETTPKGEHGGKDQDQDKPEGTKDDAA